MIQMAEWCREGCSIGALRCIVLVRVLGEVEAVLCVDITRRVVHGVQRSLESQALGKRWPWVAED
jgi:hypothetical protein